MLTVDHLVQVRIHSPGSQRQNTTATLRYYREDPHAVHLTFSAAGSLDGVDVTWTFARSLLTAELRAPSGYGDVQVWAHGFCRTMIELRAQEGIALVDISTADIQAFLSRTHEAVPAGEEIHQLDFDTALMALIGDE